MDDLKMPYFVDVSNGCIKKIATIEEIEMKKHWIIGVAGDTDNKTYYTLEDAIVGAKKRAHLKQKNGNYSQEVCIYEALQQAVVPVPDIEMKVLN